MLLSKSNVTITNKIMLLFGNVTFNSKVMLLSKSNIAMIRKVMLLFKK